MATSRFSKVDEYGFERPPDFDYISYEDFMSEYLKVLAKQAKKWSDLLGNGRSIMKNRLAKRYIRKGIPCEHRGKESDNLDVKPKVKNGIKCETFENYESMKNEVHEKQNPPEINDTDVEKEEGNSNSDNDWEEEFESEKKEDEKI